MPIAMSLYSASKLSYFTFPEKKEITVGNNPSAEFNVDWVEGVLCLKIDGNKVKIRENVSGKTKEYEGTLDKAIAIQQGQRIAFYLTRTNDPVVIDLPDSAELNIGRSNKKQEEAYVNDIVVSNSFVSGEHLKIEVSDGIVSFCDKNSTNGIYLNGNRINSGKLKAGDVLSVCTLRIVYNGKSIAFENAASIKQNKKKITPKLIEAELSPLSNIRIYHKRSPRFLDSHEKRRIDLEAPPKGSGSPQINWLNVLVTPLISVSLMLVMVFVIGMNPGMLIMSGAMSVVSAIMAIVNYNSQKKKFANSSKQIEEKYKDYLKAEGGRITKAHNNQLSALNKANPTPIECAEIALNKKSSLWERRPEDDDFLNVRVGQGTIAADVYAEYKEKKIIIEEDPLEQEAIALAKSSRHIENAPILCNIREDKLVGVVGGEEKTSQIVRNIIVELATTHSYDELKIVAVFPDRLKDKWAWVRWLPHCADNSRENRFIITDSLGLHNWLEEIDLELTSRAAEGKGLLGGSPVSFSSHYLFVIFDPTIIKSHPIVKRLLSTEANGSYCIFVSKTLSALPTACSRIIETNGDSAVIYTREDSSNRTSFSMDDFTLSSADGFARSLAPVYTDTESLGGSLPKNISFLEGYGVETPEQLNIGRRWSRAKTYKSLSVPIGKRDSGENFEFDIHARKHGVMGIVAGMPGSGKTEMVQSWLLSMAVNFSPQDVSFVLIDFKGTDLISPFRRLPHLAGSISNLNTKSYIDRSLIALRNELRRRQDLFDKYGREKGEKLSINSYNAAFDKGEVPEKLPVLLVVIDEFAQFKKEFPDFGKEIDTLTATGRSLGVFALLMSQKPGGIVSPLTEDNINFRWCLRVANYQASKEMLGRPDAARINNPGRAYVKIGADEIYEQVQSFWSGAPYNPNSSFGKERVPISRVELNGTRVPCERFEKKQEASSQPQIAAIVNHIQNYCKTAGIPSATKVWSDELPDKLCLSNLLREGFNGVSWPDNGRKAAVIGLLDDPYKQQQYPLVLDPAISGHTVIFGAPVTGKTTLLKTFIMSLAMQRRPDEASIYIMDFGGWNMKALESLPHVGGIACDNEPERLKKLILLLEEELSERRRKFAGAGVGNLEAYIATSGEHLPELFLVVDGIGLAMKLYPDMADFFMALTGQGASYGMYFVATASAVNAVPYKLAPNIKNLIALQLNDKSDYTQTVGKVNNMLPQIMGRGLIKGNPPLEFQTALPAPGDNDKELTENIRMIANTMCVSWTGKTPAAIPEMPETVSYGSIKGEGIYLGLSVDRVLPVNYDYDRQHYLLISGMSGSGKSTVLEVVSRQLKEKLGGKIYVFDVSAANVHFKECSDEYLTNAQDIDQFVEKLVPELQYRHKTHKENQDSKFEPIIIAIDNFSTLFSQISNDTANRLRSIVKLGEGLALYLIVADDAYSLSSLVNKGEATMLSMAKSGKCVLLGGCLNDHNAFMSKMSGISIAEKNEKLGKYEGVLLADGQHLRFKSMSNKET